VSSLVTKSAEKIGVVIPTYNAAKHWKLLHGQLSQQQIPSGQIVIIDSSSTDDTRALAELAGYQVVCIRKEEFNHGATRQLACSYLPGCEVIVFLTQDAVLAQPDSIVRLCEGLEDSAVGAVYGRQIPRENADPIERHGRLFNYPAETHIRTLNSRHKLGFKTVFFSNSFAAYRRSALEEVGGFPSNAIVSEEVTVIARMLMAGWNIAYQAEATAIHSHHLTLRKEFSRYFDIGVHHGRAPWLLETFGTAGNNGMLFMRSEYRFLLENAPLWLPYATMRLLSRYTAYRLGVAAKFLPRWLCKAISAHPAFWDDVQPEFASASALEAQRRTEDRQPAPVPRKSTI
jgi:rhamnosyltransferase